MIDHRADRFEEAVTGIDLVLDLVGGETTDRSWAVLAPGGTIVSSVQASDNSRAEPVGARPGRWFLTESNRTHLQAIVASMRDWCGR